MVSDLVKFLEKTLSSILMYIFESRAFKFVAEVICRILALIFNIMREIARVIASVIRYIVSAVTGPIRWWLDQITAN